MFWMPGFDIQILSISATIIDNFEFQRFFDPFTDPFLYPMSISEN